MVLDDSEAESEAGERSKGLKFDKSKLRTAITKGGGRVLQVHPGVYKVDYSPPPLPGGWNNIKLVG